MALPQQLPGISVVPQAAQIDPRLFALDAQGALMSAQLGMKLGQEMAGLQNLKSKLELEKAEIAAKKANHALQEKYALQAETQLPLVAEAAKQKLIADTEASKAAYQASLADQQIRPFATKLALLNTDVGILKGTNEQASLAAFSAGGGPMATGTAAANQALTAVKTAARLPEEQAALTARATTAASKTGEMEGVLAGARIATGQAEAPITPSAPAPFYLSRPNALPANVKEDFFTNPPMPLIEFKPTQVEDPVTKSVKLVSLAYNKLNGARVPSRDQEGGLTVRLGEEPDKARVIALAQTLQMAQDAKNALEGYEAGQKGGSMQALGAVLAGTPTEGPISIGKRALGNWIQSSETAALNSKLAALSNTITKEISGSGVTGSEMNRLSPMLVTTGDLVDPKAAKAKLDGTIKYLNELLDPYEKRGSVTRARIGPIAGRETTSSTSLAGQPGVAGERRTTPQGTYVFVTLPDGRSGWKKQ